MRIKLLEEDLRGGINLNRFYGPQGEQKKVEWFTREQFTQPVENPYCELTCFFDIGAWDVVDKFVNAG